MSKPVLEIRVVAQDLSRIDSPPQIVLDAIRDYVEELLNEHMHMNVLSVEVKVRN